MLLNSGNYPFIRRCMSEQAIQSTPVICYCETKTNFSEIAHFCRPGYFISNFLPDLPCSLTQDFSDVLMCKSNTCLNCEHSFGKYQNPG